MKKQRIKCKICGIECRSFGGLQSHVAQKHELKSKEYYDMYEKQKNEGICPECGKETSYQNISKGYLKDI